MLRRALQYIGFAQLGVCYIKIAEYHVGSVSWVFYIYLLCFKRLQLEGPSMCPTVKIAGEFGVVDSFSWKHDIRAVDYGDVIVFKSPTSSHLVMKRVIGLVFIFFIKSTV